ncbi:bifunctional phosphoribosylaminoimidazolecarboxamide formyltransferase/IMP cyclohydrolase [Propylenella binzhouense]|uniref:Bifunctional purine biosynthesis protein PurH n=1 Tax=Propylenella binzhouense TaxID=2555902 RepID=A0A964T8P7_9HYPH|nr:bifunctional phosphoribosylaminoimidazolecarboxamide formyltransferase/IMP cyclohydrolase [Propylenella binzhouense]MYZ49407.1 bifunctional phosphoribosylaminoimidazolecarboxamide formyltransferase/IMP cyclohydrolase [Propylenella binzhouense]
MASSAQPAPDGPDFTPIRRALLSVSDKEGLLELARGLAASGVELVSTGGTAKAIAEAGLAVTEVSAVTGMAEMMDGRVKTLHPKIHGGLLALRDDPEHRRAMDEHGIAGIDLLVVNLYPFEETVAGEAPFGVAVENIDIGGPAMIRAAAKNAAHVGVVVDVADYGAVLEAIATHGGLPRAMRRSLAAKAFARTAAYDAAIATWYAGTLGETLPSRIVVAGTLEERLRYGENPHQEAALYVTGERRPGVAAARKVQGKALSYNNISDADAAFEAVAEFRPEESAAVAIIKHANPCGVALADDLVTAYEKALRCDPVSAYGGIVALNRPLDETAARAITSIFTEVVIAPGADEAAKAVFAEKVNLRLLLTGGLPDPRGPGHMVRTVAGGLLVQSRDAGAVSPNELRVVTRRAPSEAELADLLFAFRVAKHVKSNAIVYAKDGATVGIGAGQMSRLDSARIAAIKAAEAAAAAGLAQPLTTGSVVASDAFFPFPDGLLAAVEAGATAAIQPGGSLRDDAVIAAADEAGIAMVFTGMRHFRH